MMSEEDKASPAKATDFLIHFLTQLKKESAGVSIPESMSTLIRQSLELAKGIHGYSEKMSTELSVDAQRLNEKTREMDFETLYKEGKTGDFQHYKEMSSCINAGNFLKMIVRITGARRILEIGTFTGFGALNMAEALPSDGKLVTTEVLPVFAEFARDFFSQTPQRDKIDVRLVSAIDLLISAGKNKEQFDLIFIDGAKSEYKDYISNILDHNVLAPRGTLLIDNTLFMGATFMENFPHKGYATLGPIVHEFNEFLRNDPRVEQAI